ncbi:MAG: hypothetical protein B7Z27_05550, partial [Sphingobacteriia bacterium 32-37-4]
MYRKLIAAILLLVSAYANAQTVQQLLAKKVLLPNGWALTPIGKSFPLGDLPLNMVLSKSKKLMAVTNNGQGTQSIQLINPITEKVLDTKIIERSWYGLVFSADEKKLYASGGHNNRIEIFSIDNNKLILTDSIVLGKKWPNKISPAGIAIDDEQQLLYVVTREDNQLYIIDIKSKKTIFKQALSGEAYACVLSPNKKQLYISCWGCDKIYLFNTIERKISVEIPVGDNPNELLLNNKGTVLYVANANDNSVSVINTKEEKVVEVLNVALYPDAPNGSTTNGLALSADEKTLFVANADNNCLAVYDVSKPIQSKSKGFIPVGWYPTNVKVVGNKIFVSNGKGFSSKANIYGPNPFANKQIVMHHEGDPNKPKGVEYIGGLFMGTMSIINMPTPKQMSVYSQVVYQNTPYNKVKEKIVQGETGNPIPRRVGDKSPIKYVFYVIKENRTYDQVLGDMKEGNGDPRLTLFGE